MNMTENNVSVTEHSGNQVIRTLFCLSLIFVVSLPQLSFAFGEIRLNDRNNVLADSMTARLIKNGFENVAATWQDRHAVVTYENRIFRYEIKAVQEVIILLMPLVKQQRYLTLIPQNENIPLVAVTVPVDEYLAFIKQEISIEKFVSTVEVSIDTDSAVRKLAGKQKINRSFYKFDILVTPQLKAQFGQRSDPIEVQINIAPELSTFLWKGMRLSAQVIIPLQNELNKEEDLVRPGLITLSQTFRLPQTTFFSTTAGYFTEQRYGVDFNIRKYFQNGRWAIGANLGYTGFASYLKGVWSYTDLDMLTTSMSADYRLSRFDLILGATYGRFLNKDKGLRLDILRQFGEVDIGFFALKTDTDTNGGFNFSIPIFPAKYLPARRLRISPASTFRWEYRYKGLDINGRQYKTGNRIIDFMKKLDPEYIKNELVNLEGWRSGETFNYN